MVTEHRLVPARARSESKRLKTAGIYSLWTPACQETSHVGHAGVGLVSLRGAPLFKAVPSTRDFRDWIKLGRVLRTVIPVGKGRVVHVVVVYGFQGADGDPEKLARTDQLFQAVMCELRVVGDGHPFLLLGDFNIEPFKIPCLAKGILDGLIVDFAEKFSASRGNLSAPTCKNAWDSEGTRRDFILGNPAAFAACTGCWVDEARWFRPHFFVKASLHVGRWTAHVTRARTYSPVWPALWLPALGPNPRLLPIRRFRRFGRCMMSDLRWLMLKLS